jgi:tetratricopeptide (TPR) repeat protein
MGFIRNLLRNRQKGQLEELLLKDPNPSVFLRLAEIYKEEGDLAKARQIAKRGAAKFPDSAEIGSAEKDLARQDREAECARLQAQIERFPNPRLYSRLAELYRSGGQNAEARATLAQGLRNYPDYGGLHYVLGQLANDEGQLEEACKHLSQATELDSYNYAALKLMGGILEKLGRPADAVAAYGSILAFAPDDQEIKDLCRKLQGGEAAPTGAKASAHAESRSLRWQDGPPAAAPKQKPVRRSTSPSADTRILSDDAVDGELGAAMKELAGASGIEGAVLVDNYGLPVAATLPAGMPEDLAAAMSTGLRRSVGPVCEQLRLGGFEELVVESGTGSIYIYALREMTLAVFGAPGSKQGMIERRANAFAAKALDLH